MKVFVVIDVGCHECGVMSLPVGIYRTAEEAQAAESATTSRTEGWRDNGQTIAETFVMDLPA